MVENSSGNVDDYSKLDSAKTHRKTHSTAAQQVDQTQLQEYELQLHEQGYVIIPDLITEQEIAELRAELEPLLNSTGRNFFEGKKTQRLYAVIEKTFVCNVLAEHPLILALLDRLFSPGYLLSQLQVINILSGEQAQPIHFDDGFYQLPRPRKPLGAATIWALDDFTEENGSTLLIPGSHQWDDRRPDEADMAKQVKCQMTAGSVVFFLGTTWHGGGANSSSNSRLAVTAQYCEGFCRTQENYFLSLSPERVAACSADMQRMLGYSVYGPFMGMVNGMHPKRMLSRYK